ncbi:MAG: hypothetical protein K0R55_2754 [Sporomusa sp.]|nr:hypothetical protein [Sporomusa sp.]
MKLGKVRSFAPMIIILLFLSFPVMAAYKAHHNDKDTAKILQAYPQAKDSKVDNCYVCHTGGKVEKKYVDACDYCHAVYGFKAPHPEGAIQKTLNPFGAAYNKAGRSIEAFATIASLDSDQDGFSNHEEIALGHLPGEANDNPSVKAAPSVVYSIEKLKRLPQTSQFMPIDTAKAGDYYATYAGVSVLDLLKNAGMTSSATDITVFSADGYSRNYSLDELRQTYKPGSYFSYYPWISYPDKVAYKNGQPIKGKLQYLVAYERDGFPLTEGGIVSGGDGGKYSLSGEGPFRLIAPSSTPVVPDRSQWSVDRGDPPYPFNHNRPVLKNADYCIKTIVAIQVNTESSKFFQNNWSAEAWQMVQKGHLVVYGAIRPINAK